MSSDPCGLEKCSGKERKNFIDVSSSTFPLLTNIFVSGITRIRLTICTFPPTALPWSPAPRTTKLSFMTANEGPKNGPWIPKSMAWTWFISPKIRPMLFMPQPKKTISFDISTCMKTSTFRISEVIPKKLWRYVWIPPMRPFCQGR